MIYKKYLGSDDRIRTNALYRKQLWELFKNQEQADINIIKKTRYNKKHLVKLFENFNDTSTSHIHKNKNKLKTHLTLKAGARFTKLSLRNDFFIENEIDFDKKTIPNIALEVESYIPLSKKFNNSWTILTGISYEQYNSRFTSNSDTQYQIDMKSIEIPLGLKYYQNISTNSRIYLSYAYLLNFDINSSLKILNGSQFRTFEGTNFTQNRYTIGYDYQKKYGLELSFINSEGDDFYNTSGFSEKQTILINLIYRFF